MLSRMKYMLSTENDSSRQVVFNYRKNTDMFGIPILGLLK